MKNQSEPAYGWCAEVPGDMHAKGYLYEVCKKVMQPGGFMHVLFNVISRNKINDDSFGQKNNFKNKTSIESRKQFVTWEFHLAWQLCLSFEIPHSFPPLRN